MCACVRACVCVFNPLVLHDYVQGTFQRCAPASSRALGDTRLPPTLHSVLRNLSEIAGKPQRRQHYYPLCARYLSEMCPCFKPWTFKLCAQRYSATSDTSRCFPSPLGGCREATKWCCPLRSMFRNSPSYLSGSNPME